MSETSPSAVPSTGTERVLAGHDRVLALGDSITDGAGGAREWFTEPADGPGWLARLSRLAAGTGVAWVNRGIGGNRVPDLLARLDADVLDAKPDLVIVYIGINDVWHWRDGRGTPEPEYRDGLAELARRLTGAGISVLMCTPTVIGERAEGLNQQDEMLGRYVAISRQTASRLGLPCCDLHAAFRTELARRNTADVESGVLTTDGVHLNDAGNELVANTLAGVLGPFDARS